MPRCFVFTHVTTLDIVAIIVKTHFSSRVFDISHRETLLDVMSEYSEFVGLCRNVSDCVTVYQQSVCADIQYDKLCYRTS